MEQVLLEHICWSQHGFTEGELCLANLIALIGFVSCRLEDANFRRISTSFSKVFVSKQGFYSLNVWAARWVNRQLDGWLTGQLLTGHHPMQPEANKRCITGTCVRYLYDTNIFTDSEEVTVLCCQIHTWHQKGSTPAMLEDCYLDRPRKARGMDSELQNSANTISVMYPGCWELRDWKTKRAKNILSCINKTTSSR